MSIPLLRQTLSENLGKVLTPQAAWEVEQAARASGGAPIDPRAFGSQQFGDYLIAAEPFEPLIAEIHPLHEAHWLETELYRHGLQLNVDYAGMVAMERAGRLIQFTVRHHGELVGNLRVYLGVSLHTQTRYANEDTLFLLPEHRGGFLVLALIKFAEDALRAIGVSEFRVNSKLVNNADVLMRRRRYTPVAKQFVKFFKE